MNRAGQRGQKRREPKGGSTPAVGWRRRDQMSTRQRSRQRTSRATTLPRCQHPLLLQPSHAEAPMLGLHRQAYKNVGRRVGRRTADRQRMLETIRHQSFCATSHSVRCAPTAPLPPSPAGCWQSARPGGPPPAPWHQPRGRPAPPQTAHPAGQSRAGQGDKEQEQGVRVSISP